MWACENIKTCIKLLYIIIPHPPNHPIIILEHIMECMDGLGEREEEMLPSKQSEKRGRAPHWLKGQRKNLRKNLP